jgi:hypothetical protein
MRTSEPQDACPELGARKAPRRLFTSLAPFRKTPTGGLLFPAGEELFSVDLELKAIVDPDLTSLGGLFCLERCNEMAASGTLFF